MAFSRIARILRWCRISRDGEGSADFPIQQVTYQGKTGNAAMWFPYGIHASIPEDQGEGVGSLALMLSMRGNAEERVALPGSPQRRPDLEPGEVAFYHPPTGAIIHFKANGDIDCAPAEGQEFIVRNTGDAQTTLSVVGTASRQTNVKIKPIAGQSGDLEFHDGGTLKWTLRKANNNKFQIRNDSTVVFEMADGAPANTFSMDGAGAISLGNSLDVAGVLVSQDKVRLTGLPTSPSGLISGNLWNDSGTVKIV